MKIRFTSTVGGRTVGEVADLDPDSARWLVDHAYAEELDTVPAVEDAPRPRRGRPPKNPPPLIDGE
ncbi:hypothetical protein AB0I28_21370 [Phytomonospora sp. NPDC050363]|uniref:hypothetical protein n=1 Tax=Phytomonospora sp. NPDC050363 TaxID=3155642 RepID=UPI003403A05E